MSRPVEYDDKVLTEAHDYLATYDEDGKFPVPTIAGLAIRLGVCKQTVYTWASNVPKLLDVLNTLRTMQELLLIGGSLTNRLNPTISKMMLSKRGWLEEQRMQHTSPDGSMTPKGPMSLAEFYAPVPNADDDKPTDT